MDESLGMFSPMQAVHIPAMHPHKIVAMVDSVFACIHYLPGE
jgi:hypothetical protein